MIIGMPYVCAYCGEPANTLDHVIPWSFLEFRERKHAGKAPGLRVWSCSGCNGILGSKMFPSFLDRCSHVSCRLRKKYAKVIDTANCWDESEINQMDGNLKKYIKNSLNLGKIMRQKAEWYESRGFWENYESMVQELENSFGVKEFWRDFFIK